MFLRALSLLLLAAFACGSDETGVASDAPVTVTADAPTASADARTVDASPTAPDAATTVTITGTAVDTHIKDDGELAVPRDLSVTPVVVLVPQGEGWQTMTGSGTAAGAFSIAGVPAGGARLVGVGRSFLATGATTLDLGRVFLGRPDAVVAEDRETGFIVDLGGLESPGATDIVNVYSPNLPEYIQHELGANTTVAGFYRPTHLVDATRGDDFWITQLATRQSGNGVLYRGLARVYTPTPFSTVEGESLVLPSGTMVAPATTVSTDLEWRRSEFHALRASVHPDAVVNGHQLIVYALPGRPKLTNADTPDLFYSLVNAQGDDLDYGAVSFGNPFPAAWELVGDARSFFRTSVTATGAATASSVFAQVSVTEPAAAWDGVAIGPDLSPPRSPTIAGRSAFAAQSGVGLLPLIAWTAPATGTPDVYSVFVDEIRNDGGATVLVRTASIVTSETAVRLPPQTLTAGGRYVARIRAVQAKGIDFAVTSLRVGMPEAAADVLTSPFSP